MRISVSEWTVLKLAAKLPRALVSPELIPAALRQHAFTRRGVAAAAIALTIGLALLHLAAADPATRRLTDLAAQLATARLIDARWDAAVTSARGATPPRPGVETADLQTLQRALDEARAQARSEALRSAIADLRRDYGEKAELVQRFERASADTRQALMALTRSDTAVTSAIRDAWRDFPQRDRLIAAENLAVRVMAEARAYHHAPSQAQRSTLEGYAADLPRAQQLPKPLQAALARLESDAHRLLLLKPLEHMLGERLAALRTQMRLDEVARVFEQQLAQAIAQRELFSLVLLLYTVAFALLAGFAIVRAIARYRDLELLYAAQTRELAKALQRLRAGERGARVAELRRVDSAPADEEARIVSEQRRQESGL